jgi:plastocyanin
MWPVRSIRAPIAVLVGSALLGLVVTACVPANLPYHAGGSGAPSSSSNQAPAAVVYLNAGSFAPPEVHIRVGQTVEWVWVNHGVPHNVTFRTFHSPTQVSGTWSHRFTLARTYFYRSTLNYNMVGKVVVSSG